MPQLRPVPAGLVFVIMAIWSLEQRQIAMITNCEGAVDHHDHDCRPGSRAWW
jgi:hypothetical protein